MDETIAAIYQAGGWAIIGILVLFAVLRNYYPGALDSIYGLLDRVLKGEPEIITVTYLGTESRPAQGSRGRVFLTALTFGLLESLLVASLEGEDTYHRFLVRYDNGKIKNVLCREDNPRYAELMSYVRWEDSFSEEQITYYSDEELGSLEKLDIDGLSGEEFEEFCAEFLQEIGFVKVRLTPHSGDQGVDILAEKQGVKYAFQCKHYSAPLGNTSVQEVNAGKTFYKCHVGVVITNSRFTPGAVALAEATGVLLWDRKTIEELLK